MNNTSDRELLRVLLDSWYRNNTILINLLRAIPEGGLELRPVQESPSIAELFTHIHYVRLVFVQENAPEHATDVPEEEWADDRDRDRVAGLLTDSARVVAEAVSSRLEAGQSMNRHYDHPLLMLQHMTWHEGYHHGQIKLTLKLAGLQLANDVAGPLTWGVWLRKSQR